MVTISRIQYHQAWDEVTKLQETEQVLWRPLSVSIVVAQLFWYMVCKPFLPGFASIRHDGDRRHHWQTLEPEPGDMLKDPEMVFANAEETARKYHERMEADIVMGLWEALDDLGAGICDGLDPLADVSDSLDSLLS